MNVVVLVGRLVRDPEIRYTQTNTAVCSVTLAVQRPVRKEQTDGKNKDADFIPLKLFGKQAETFQKYLAKGRQVAIEGRIQTGSYQNTKGDTVYTTEVIVSRFDFIGSRQDSSPNDRTMEQPPLQNQQTRPGYQESYARAGNEAPVKENTPYGFEYMEEDLPF